MCSPTAWSMLQRVRRPGRRRASGGELLPLRRPPEQTFVTVYHYPLRQPLPNSSHLPAAAPWVRVCEGSGFIVHKRTDRGVPTGPQTRPARMNRWPPSGRGHVARRSGSRVY